MSDERERERYRAGGDLYLTSSRVTWRQSQREVKKMAFPKAVTSTIDSHNGQLIRNLTLYRPFSVIVGPNGSGKTHLLRGLKTELQQHAGGKKVRYLSAGRMGMLEQFRSDFDGHRGNSPMYDQARYGSKTDLLRRHNMETLNGDFQTLAERADIQIKIQERLRKLFKRDLLIDWDGGELKVEFNRTEGESKPYSSGREASGLMHLVGILSALYDDEVGALLIDEPEVSLHPQLQAFLLREIKSIAGEPTEADHKKIVIIATHSTEMVTLRSADDLPSLIFCNDLMSDPRQVAPDEPTLKAKKLTSLMARLGQSHKLALFSRRPLLVEGASDAIIAQSLANKLDLYPEAAGSQILPVEGKEQIVPLVKLLRLLGKEPTVLADIDAFTDGTDVLNQFLSGSRESAAEASKLGAESAEKLASNVHQSASRAVEEAWPTIGSTAEKHSYWVTEAPEELRRRRAGVATLLGSDLGIWSEDNRYEELKNTKQRVKALFDLAERCGLFFLRKGTVEDYYIHRVDVTAVGKPEAAATEAEHIAAASAVDVRERYADLIRCIEHASNAVPIREAEAMQDLLLAIVPPAQGRLLAGDADIDLDLLARQAVGDRAKIFKLSRDGGKLTIDLRSKILDVASCFPIKLDPAENAVVAVPKYLNLID